MGRKKSRFNRDSDLSKGDFSNKSQNMQSRRLIKEGISPKSPKRVRASTGRKKTKISNENLIDKIEREAHREFNLLLQINKTGQKESSATPSYYVLKHQLSTHFNQFSQIGFLKLSILDFIFTGIKKLSFRQYLSFLIEGLMSSNINVS
jgi:hypothetical protein